MKKLILILIILFIVPWTLCQAQNTVADSLLRKEVHEFGQARISIINPGSRRLNELSSIVSIGSVRNNIAEIIISPLTIDWFLDQKLDYKIEEREEIKSEYTAGSVKEAMEWDKYPTYTQYDSIMRSFASKYPALCRLDTIGKSIYGKLVMAVKISDNVSADEDEPEAFYSSSIHGDETGGYILMLRLADYLLKNYTSNSRVRNLVDNLEIWINPLANPDGTYRTGNTISSPTRYNANGYDLNRNFPDPDYPNTTKQKETLDMVSFMRKHKFVISANFHAGEEVVNYPWDRWSRLHADDNWFYSISRKYADTAHLHAPSGYMTFLENGITNGYDWYKVNGGRQDFITGELQGREVTIELDYSYVTPPADLNTLWQSNYRSLLGYLENATGGIHGKVRDAVTGAAVRARIFIYGHDKDSSHVYSDNKTGSYVRLIAPGSWDLTFTANGYVEKKAGAVMVTEGQKTVLDVSLMPIMNPIDTVNTPVPLLYPNPGKEYIKVVLPGHQTGNVNITIYNSMGNKLLDYNTVTYRDTPVFLDISKYAGGVYTLIITNNDTKIRNKARFIVTPGN